MSSIMHRLKIFFLFTCLLKVYVSHCASRKPQMLRTMTQLKLLASCLKKISENQQLNKSRSKRDALGKFKQLWIAAFTYLTTLREWRSNYIVRLI